MATLNRNLLSYAATSNGKVSKAALGTWVDICASITREANTPMYDKINPIMLERFFDAKAEAKNKREFVKLAKAKTGLLKSDNQFILAFVERWY